MQDLQMLFGGGGGGERRLKTHNQQALKCPRCDSLNTKFCYYNNYNLSQPRFFCKGCRRYWTNGGVLRNVPVGGGCRKNKRSKQKSGNGNPLPTSELKSSDSQNSSSDSSTTFTQTPFTLSEGTPTLFSPNQRFDPPLLDTSDHSVLSEMGTFGSLITSCSYQMSLGSMQKEDVKIDELNSLGFVGEVGYTRPSSHSGVAAAAVEEDWGLFDQSYLMNNLDYHSNYFP